MNARKNARDVAEPRRRKKPDTRTTAKKPDTRTTAEKIRDSIPSWRFFVALIVGTLVGFGALQIATQDSRQGRLTSSVTIVDEVGLYDAELLEQELSSVVWGRQVRVLVYVGEANAESTIGLCMTGGEECIGGMFPTHFVQEWSSVNDDVVALWINPTTRTADFSMRALADNAWQSLYGFIRGANNFIGYHYAAGDLDEKTTADTFQALADVEVGADQSSGRGWRLLIAIAAGILAGLLTWLALTAIVQARHAKRAMRSMIHTTRSERRDMVREVRAAYTAASHDLETIELVGLNDAGAYKNTLEARVSQWQLSYSEFARLMFDAQGQTDSELAEAKNSPLLMQLHRLARNVDGARAHLLADEKALREKNFDGHRATPDLQRALRSVAELGASTENRQLIREAHKWENSLRRAEELKATNPEEVLRIWDFVAGEMASQTETSLASYRISAGKEFPQRAIIEDAAQLRSLGAIEPGGMDKPKRGRTKNTRKNATVASAKELSERLSEAQGEERERSSLRVPISPSLIAGAAAISILLGSVVALTSEAAGVRESTDAYATIPDELIDDVDNPSRYVREEIGERGGEDLVPPSSISIHDNAGLFEDPEALEEALGSLGMRSEVHLVVVTEEHSLPVINDRVNIRRIYDQYPEYFYPTDRPIVNDYDVMDNYVVVWIAADGQQSGVAWASWLLRAPDAPYTYFWNPPQELAIADQYPVVGVWNSLVAVAHHNRGINPEIEGSTIATGDSIIKRAIITALIAFPIVLIVGLFALTPWRRRQQSKQWFAEMRSTMTALTMAHDALKLEVNYVDRKHSGYDAATRWQHWEVDYLSALHVTRMSEHTSDVKREWRKGKGKLGQLERLTKLNVARMVRAQAESLWRMRAILESEPGWANAWDDEVAHTYAAKQGANTQFGNQLVAASRKLQNGDISAQRALIEIDRIATKFEEPARLRCVRDVDDPLTESAASMAMTGVFSLEKNDAVAFGSNRGIRSDSLDASEGEAVTRVVRADDAAASFQLSVPQRLFHLLKEIPKKLFDSSKWKDRISSLVLVFFVLTLIWPYFDVMPGYRDWGVAESKYVITNEQPASVTVDDELGLFDDARVERAIASANVGSPLHIYIFSYGQHCDYATLQTEIRERGGDNFDLVRTSETQAYPASNAVFICMSRDSIYEMSLSDLRRNPDVEASVSLGSYRRDYPHEWEPTEFIEAYFGAATEDQPLFRREYDLREGIGELIDRVGEERAAGDYANGANSFMR